MHKNLLVRSNEIIDENDDPCIVTLTTPITKHYSSREVETWVALLEQDLACNYHNYEVTVVQDEYAQTSRIKVQFSNIEDATLFKLQRSH